MQNKQMQDGLLRTEWFAIRQRKDDISTQFIYLLIDTQQSLLFNFRSQIVSVDNCRLFLPTFPVERRHPQRSAKRITRKIVVFEF